MEKFGYKNKMAVPKITKVTVNSSFGKDSVSKTGSAREKIQNAIVQDLALIAGQRPTLVKSKKSADLLSRAIQKKPEVAYLHYLLAERHIEGKEFEEAIHSPVSTASFTRSPALSTMRTSAATLLPEVKNTISPGTSSF